MNCVFCKIVDGKIPSYTVYEDEILKCFLDIEPKSNGHILVIPKKHIKDLDEMDEQTWNHLLKVIKQLKKELEETLKIDGLTLTQNNGEVQEVKHFHMHLEPYYQSVQEIIAVDKIYDQLKK